MGGEKRGLSIILHSDSYDRIYQGLEIALTALSLDREVHLFFSYWALEYLRIDNEQIKKIEGESEHRKRIILDGLERGRIKNMSELFTMAKQLGANIYSCPGSMSLLNLKRKDLIEEVDESMGLPLFLMKTENDQLIFI